MEETPEKTRSHPLKTAKTLLLGAVLCIAGMRLFHRRSAIRRKRQ